jgi:hypothetical protein
MKKFNLLVITLFVFSQFATAQVPDIIWSDNYGGTSDEQAKCIQQTYDSGFVVAGHALSTNGDVHGNNGGYDYWVVKLNKSHDTLWTKAFGGTSMEWATSIQQTFDSGYIVAGFTQSNDGYVSGNHGNRDFWVVRLNPDGDTLWTKCFGGSNDEEANAIQQTYDSGFIVAGYTKSNDGDVNGNHGLNDFWVVKLNVDGDTLWTKTLGGSSYDQAYSIQQTFDSGYIVVGSARSTNGDVHGNHGNNDFWTVKLNSNGDTSWTKCFGGSGNEYAQSVQQTCDSGYIIAGGSNSTNGDVHGNHGSSDFWVIRLTTSADTIWTKTFGGMSYDYAYSIQQIHDGGFVVAGETGSSDGDVYGNHGDDDFWVVRLNSNSDTIWTRALGGTQKDIAYSIQQNFDSTYIIAGRVQSNNGDVGDNNGYLDFWVVQLAESTCPTPSSQTESNITTSSVELSWIENGHASAWQIMLDTAGFDTIGAVPVSVSTNPYVWSGLNENTTYDWYVRSDCGWGGYSIWTGPHPFWTICSPKSTPFVEDFTSDTLPDCWSMTGIPYWQFSTGAGDGAAGAGDHTPGGGTNYAWTEAPTMGSTLYTPLINIDSLSNPSLSFWYFFNETSASGDAVLEVYFWDGATWSSIFNNNTDDTVWRNELIDLSNYSVSGPVQFRFWAQNSPVSGGNGDVLIDDILVDEYPPPPGTLWANTFGGTDDEWAYSIQQTYDSGFVVAGKSQSTDMDVHGNHGADDFWIVKLDKDGDTLWTKCLGGSSDDIAQSIQQTFDSGYIVAGYSWSADGDVHGNHGTADYWVVKLKNNGDTLWTKTYGGLDLDLAYSIQQTYDSGFVLAGETVSQDGDVHGSHGGSDFWVVKIDINGDTLWTKTLGGSGNDYAKSIQQTYDSGYVVTGYVASNDGDVHGNHGAFDFWIVKLNSTGDTLWTKTCGGTDWDIAYSIQQTYDSGYVVTGYVASNDGDVHGNHGGYDFWVVKLDSDGDTLWTKTLGGSDTDVAYSIHQTSDSGYIVAGYSRSIDADVHGNQGNSDFWVVKLNSMGDTLWTKTVGGSNDEWAWSVQQTFDKTYIVAGYTESNDGDVHGNHGGADFWVVEIEEYPNHIYQTISLLSGWNIMSFNVTPNDTNMLHIVQPLIDSSELVKVMDESGGFIQNIPGIGWMNTIGDMANTEGYYTKVNANTQLQTTGLPVALPYTIPLITGWNIMGYPLQQSQDALTAVQPLVDDGELTKVMDESGGFIQDIPGIGWMNTIGDFEAGEGYYIKVTNNTSLTLDNPPVLFIGSPPNVQKHPVFFSLPETNPYMPMNIIVTGINIDGYTIQSGDEIAVFDNNRLTGAGVINTGNKALTSFAAAMDDPTTTEIDGYIEGNIPAFRFKSANLNGSIQLSVKPVFGDLKFSPLGTLACTLEGSITAIEEQKEKTFALKCVPNPANNYTNIQYQLPEEGQLQLEVYDLSSHRIAVLQNEQQSAGSYTYRFDAALLERGIYLIKIQLRTKDNQYTEVVKFVRN